ncbi:hypothetical protein CEUSTIGMA_g11461.t1 [Chlamydomonas eustigma]|uniref:F-box/LRR-repeat protein 15-like leucin rich repeat domain-containing protein n=1 Tax=Chlamydomonas eustigma TaxID=1157962 RepID=A0A250XLU6_9CHLO|nr:hypothetical protein CEUSTIGMA_g11461.t1 [Chlamydomonas eustigma]|eukprot:GAX84037.1 hypothetical protein CEUSTIGMA_g11461.t1 [Chlamydomonas eustigma]
MNSSESNVNCLLLLPRPVTGFLLRFLPPFEQLKVATTCQALRSVVEDECLPWIRNLDLLGFSGQRTVSALTWLTGCGHVTGLAVLAVQGAACSESVPLMYETPIGQNLLGNLRSLNIQSWKKLDSIRLSSILVYCRSLTTLCFNDCMVGDEGLAVIASCCPQLLSLNCSHCRKVTDDGVSKIALGCKELQIITLDGCVQCTSQSVALLAMHCPLLHSLSVAKCFRIGNSAIEALRRNACFHIASSHSMVQHSYVAHHHAQSTNSATHSMSVGEDSQHWDSSLAASITGQGHSVSSVLFSSQPSPACLMLRSLCLTICHRVSILEPLGSLNSLEHLELTGCVQVCDSQLLRAVSGSSQKLKSLRLNNCMQLSGEGVVAAARACPNLEVFCLRALSLVDLHLEALSKNTHHLLELNLNSNHAITDVGLQPLLAANPQLQTLEIEGLYCVSDRLIAHLPYLVPQLMSLNLRMCNNVRAGTLLCLITGRLTWTPSLLMNDGSSATRHESAVGGGSVIDKTNDTTMEEDTGDASTRGGTCARADADNAVIRNASCLGTGKGDYYRTTDVMRCLGCHRLSSMQLGGVMGESETSWLVKELKAAKPDLILRA